MKKQEWPREQALRASFWDLVRRWKEPPLQRSTGRVGLKSLRPPSSDSREGEEPHGHGEGSRRPPCPTPGHVSPLLALTAPARPAWHTHKHRTAESGPGPECSGSVESDLGLSCHPVSGCVSDKGIIPLHQRSAGGGPTVALLFQTL